MWTKRQCMHLHS
ncbi:ribosomal protein L7/L12, partial [Trichinella spiralis]